MKRLKKELNLSMIFITHDLSILAEISDKVAIMYAGKIVEIGDSEKIYYEPAHPYTQKLLAAIPRLHEDVERLEFIPGQPPNLINRQRDAASIRGVHMPWTFVGSRSPR